MRKDLDTTDLKNSIEDLETVSLFGRLIAVDPDRFRKIPSIVPESIAVKVGFFDTSEGADWDTGSTLTYSPQSDRSYNGGILEVLEEEILRAGFSFNLSATVYGIGEEEDDFAYEARIVDYLPEGRRKIGRVEAGPFCGNSREDVVLKMYLFVHAVDPEAMKSVKETPYGETNPLSHKATAAV